MKSIRFSRECIDDASVEEITMRMSCFRLPCRMAITTIYIDANAMRIVIWVWISKAFPLPNAIDWAALRLDGNCFMSCFFLSCQLYDPNPQYSLSSHLQMSVGLWWDLDMTIKTMCHWVAMKATTPNTRIPQSIPTVSQRIFFCWKRIVSNSFRPFEDGWQFRSTFSWKSNRYDIKSFSFNYLFTVTHLRKKIPIAIFINPRSGGNEVSCIPRQRIDRVPSSCLIWWISGIGFVWQIKERVVG